MASYGIIDAENDHWVIWNPEGHASTDIQRKIRTKYRKSAQAHSSIRMRYNED